MAEPVEEEIEKELPTEEEPAEVVEDEPVEPEEPEEEEEEEKPPSRRENLRIQKLIQQRDEAAAKTSVELPKGGLDYGKELDASPEVVAQLNADRDAYGKSLYQQGIDQANSIRFQTRLEVDAPRVEAKHPQLDKDSPEFHAVLANAINTMYLSAVGYNEKTGSVRNPNIRYSDYVESMFELASEMADQQTVSAKKSIAKQAASTGLRPDGGGSKRMNLSKAPKDMSNEELEAVIGMAMK